MTVTDDVDPKWLERLYARDEHAFSKLVLLHQARILALTTRLLSSPSDGEEITQEVFVQAFKHIDQFRGDAKLSTWLYRIAVNLCKNKNKYLRRRRVNESTSLEELHETAQPAPGAHATMARVGRPDELASARQLHDTVRIAISQIDEAFRECLILRDVEELSYEEIGEITSLPPGTVKSRIFRARAMLRERIEELLGRTKS